MPLNLCHIVSIPISTSIGITECLKQSIAQFLLFKSLVKELLSPQFCALCYGMGAAGFGTHTVAVCLVLCFVLWAVGSGLRASGPTQLLSAWFCALCYGLWTVN